jgi:hypothetical protein
MKPPNIALVLARTGGLLYLLSRLLYRCIQGESRCPVAFGTAFAVLALAVL